MHPTLATTAVLIISGAFSTAQPATSTDRFQQLADRYAKINTLDATITQNRRSEGAPNRPAVTITQSWAYELRLDRKANRMTILSSWGDLASGSDEFLITCYECNTYETLPAKPLSMTALTREEHNNTTHTLRIPVLDLLLGDRTHEYSQTKGLRPTGEMRTETLDGETHTVIEATIPYSNDETYMLDVGPELTSPAEYWVNSDGLLTRVHIDHTDATRIWTEQTYGDEYADYTKPDNTFLITYDIEYHSVDTPVDPARFAVSTEGLDYEDTPAHNDEQFSSFDGAAYLHKPLPHINATTIAGEKFSTEDLDGKVVIIDFWATWCPPCVAAMPMLEQLANEYADRGLVVIGINQDDTDERAAVDTFLENKNITFPQIHDPNDAIGARFGVSAIPTTLIVDAQGIVQAYTVGLHDKATYAQNIDKVLAGESLPKPEAPPSPADTVDIVENLTLNTLVWPAPVSAWEGNTLTLDSGDAFVMPHDTGGLAKLDHATGQLTRIALQGYDPDRTTLAFAPVNDKHGGWVFVTDSAIDYDDANFTRIAASGTRRWSVPLGIDPAIEPMYDAGVETCDIDNDGEDEFLIAIGVTDTTTWDEQVFLVVLENNGKAIYTKPLPIDGFGTTHLVENQGEPPILYVFGYEQLARITLDF